jgi:rhomboid protease GluP
LEELKKEPVTAGLMLLNILIFFLVDLSGGSENTMHMVKCGAAYTPYILDNHEFYRLFTCMFLHFGMAHLANNMLVLFVLGGRLERSIGKIKFLVVYLVGGVLGNVVSMLLDLHTEEYAVSAGASGAVFAVLGGLIYLILRNRGKVEDLSARQILVMAVLSTYLGFTSSGVDNAAHLGGMAGGFLLAVLLYHPKKIRKVLP